MTERRPLILRADAALPRLQELPVGDLLPTDTLGNAIKVLLQGLVTGNNAGITSTDTVLQALGKLQAQTRAKVDKDGAKVLSDNNFTNAERVKLANVAENASANSSDAFLLNRSNHSGAQPLSTITGVGTAAAMNALGVGGIIERGSNDNGEYVKFADGTLICTYNRLINRRLEVGYTFDPAVDFAASFSGYPVTTFNVNLYTEANGAGIQLYSLRYNYGDLGHTHSVLNTGVAPANSFPGFTLGTYVAKSLRVQGLGVGRWK